jgi:hypothetical protein
VVDLLGRGPLGGHPVVILGQRLHPDATAPADHIKEKIRGDAVQPALEGAGLVALQRSEHPDEGLLGEVLGVMLIARQPICQPVNPVGMLTHQLVP